MQKNLLPTIFILLFSVALITPFITNAQLNLRKKPTLETDPTNTFATGAGFETNLTKTQTVETLVGTLINTFLGLLGILFLVLIIYGGFKWMNAQGAEEDVTKAKNIITQAVIGLVIIMAAYAISAFVIGRIQEKTLKTSLPTHFV